MNSIVTLGNLRLLPGRALVRPDTEAQKLGLQLILPPDWYVDDPRRLVGPGAAQKQRTLGSGVIAALGPPPRTRKGVRADLGLLVGDRVLYVGQHHSRLVQIGDITYAAIAHEEVVVSLGSASNHEGRL